MSLLPYCGGGLHEIEVCTRSTDSNIGEDSKDGNLVKHEHRRQQRHPLTLR